MPDLNTDNKYNKQDETPIEGGPLLMPMQEEELTNGKGERDDSQQPD